MELLVRGYIQLVHVYSKLSLEYINITLHYVMFYLVHCKAFALR